MAFDCNLEFLEPNFTTPQSMPIVITYREKNRCSQCRFISADFPTPLKWKSNFPTVPRTVPITEGYHSNASRQVLFCFGHYSIRFSLFTKISNFFWIDDSLKKVTHRTRSLVFPQTTERKLEKKYFPESMTKQFSLKFR